MIKVFYNKKQTASSNESFSPSAGKPEKVVKRWIESGHPIEICDFRVATESDIGLVHDHKYVEGVLAGKIPNGFGNTSPDVTKSLPWVCGSMMAAALHSYQNKENTFSPTSGAHHAHYSHGSGFCTFNSLVLAALMAHKYGAKKVGIIDLDQHYGDGTDDIIRERNFDFIEHYSFGRQQVSRGKRAGDWLSGLEAALIKQMSGCDLLLFNAGVDPHINDPLGGVLTTDEFYIRDHIVYQVAKGLNIPIVTSLAGGYQKAKDGSINAVLELHDQTMRVYREVFETSEKVHSELSDEEMTKAIDEEIDRDISNVLSKHFKKETIRHIEFSTTRYFPNLRFSILEEEVFLTIDQRENVKELLKEVQSSLDTGVSTARVVIKDINALIESTSFKKDEMMSDKKGAFITYKALRTPVTASEIELILEKAESYRAPPQIIKRSYSIRNWARFDADINAAATEFYNATGIYPNILIASDETLKRLDFMANQKQENIKKPDPNYKPKIEEEHWKPIDSFATSKYSLDFFVDNALLSPNYTLIFDSDPDGDGGEPIPKEEKLPIVKAKVVKKKTRAA